MLTISKEFYLSENFIHLIGFSYLGKNTSSYLSISLFFFGSLFSSTQPFSNCLALTNSQMRQDLMIVLDNSDMKLRNLHESLVLLLGYLLLNQYSLTPVTELRSTNFIIDTSDNCFCVYRVLNP